MQWDRVRRRTLPYFPLEGADTVPLNVAFSPLDAKVAFVCLNGLVVLIDRKSGKNLREQLITPVDPRTNLYSGPSRRVAFSLDGSQFAVWGLDTGVHLYSATDGQPITTLATPGFTHDVRFSTDRKRLLTTTIGRDETKEDGWLVVWELTSHRQIAACRHRNWVFNGRFDGTGTRVLTACRDGHGRIWDLSRPDQWIAETKGSHDEMFDAAFLPGDRVFVTTGKDSTTRFWDALSGEPAAPDVRMAGRGFQLLIPPDGAKVVVAGSIGGLHVIDLPWKSNAAASRLDVRLAGLSAGYRFRPASGPESLSNEDWADEWAKFRRTASVEPAYQPRSEVAADWHAREGGWAVTDRAWHAAEWHFTRLVVARPGEALWAFRLGEVLVQRKRWGAAADAFRLAARTGAKDVPPDDLYAFEALAALRGGDVARYRTMCTELVARCQKDGRLQTISDEVVFILCTAPDPDLTLDPLVAHLRRRLDDAPTACTPLHLYGAALVRTGDLDEAEKVLTRAVTTHRRQGELSDQLFLALIAARKGRAAEAEERLAVVRRALDDERWETRNGITRALTWAEASRARLLLAEVEQLVKAARPG